MKIAELADRAGIAALRRSLVRAGRRPSGTRPLRERIPRLRGDRPRPAAARCVAPPARARPRGRRPDGPPLPRARRHRPRPRAHPRVAARGHRPPAAGPRPPRERARRPRADHRGRRPSQEDHTRAGADPRPVHLHPQQRPQPDRRGPPRSLRGLRLRRPLGRHRGDPGQPVRRPGPGRGRDRLVERPQQGPDRVPRASRGTT